MPASRVAIVLPIYREHRADEIAKAWVAGGHVHSGHDNVAFDLHFYHSLGGYRRGLPHGKHVAATRRHGGVLATLPGAVVGEWSLARNGEYSHHEVSAWCQSQCKTWELNATHGWFFWTWRDHPSLPHWSWCAARVRGWVPHRLGSAGSRDDDEATDEDKHEEHHHHHRLDCSVLASTGPTGRINLIAPTATNSIFELRERLRAITTNFTPSTHTSFIDLDTDIQTTTHTTNYNNGTATGPPALPAAPATTPGKSRVRSVSPHESTSKRVRRAVVDLEDTTPTTSGVCRRLLWNEEESELLAGPKRFLKDEDWGEDAVTVS